MHGYEVTNAEPRLRCVLPFEAGEGDLAGLRRIVRARLRAWGMSAITSEAQLAVTELATNVIQHVGPGAAATLVLDATGGRLRVELHDRSHKVPSLLNPGCGDECGRGLHLLAGMAADWGTVISAAGKAVWCEFDLPLDQNRRSLQRATAVVETYTRAVGSPATALSHPRVVQETATSMISDLLHWLAAQGFDPDSVLDQAQMHYEAVSQGA